MTPATKELINVIRGPKLLRRGNLKAVEYGQSLSCNGDKLTLHKVDHILGAAQVLVEDPEGTRILYTGDFRMKNTPVIPSDVLVIEATYGNPQRRRDFKHETEPKLISVVKEGLEQGPVYIFGYHGKLQEVMQILHEARVNVPFIMPERILRISKVHQRFNGGICRPLFCSKHELQTTLVGDDEYIAFHHMNSRKKTGLDKFRVLVSGWEFYSPCRQIGEKEYLVALSDHSDFEGLLEYVRQSQPRLVITDNYRAGDAEALAMHIRDELEIEAKPLPS
jgi:putative mRNA 3-end processing factor